MKLNILLFTFTVHLQSHENRDRETKRAQEIHRRINELKLKQNLW